MPIKIQLKEPEKGFLGKIREISGENIFQCYQCGMCSTSCPMVHYMDESPRRMMRLAQLGLIETLAKIETYWVCSSCQNCGVVCPRGIDLPRVLEALRLMTLRENKNYVVPSQEFMNSFIDWPTIAMVSGFRKLSS